MSGNIVDFPLSDRPIAETDIETLRAGWLKASTIHAE